MGVKRYVATADNTITNAFKSNLKTRGTGSNMGAADILETFHIYAQATTSSLEDERIVIQFPVSDITTSRDDGIIPASGSVDFYLRMYNAKHSQTVPRDFDLVISAISGGQDGSVAPTAWEEGTGLDMEGYTDLTYDVDGSNWIERAGSTAWTSEGGDYYIDVSSSFTASFVTGIEDLELDITPLVEQWLDSAGNVLGAKGNNGVLIKLRNDLEDASKSYYTKKFFSRTSEFFLKRPVIEARWDSTKRDDRGNFHFSSSVAPAADNLNTFYLYNVINGQLQNIPSVATGILWVSLYSGSGPANTVPDQSKLKLPPGGGIVAAEDTNITGGYVSTGIYSASFAVTGTSALTKIFDVWHKSGTQFFTGSSIPKTFVTSEYNPNPTFVTSITNLKDVYSTREKDARIRLFTRKEDWSPTIYTVASKAANGEIINDVYYKLFRVTDGWEIVPFATGSSTPQAVGNAQSYTRLSYDASGSYIDVDMSILEPGYAYALQFMHFYNNGYREQPTIFKFRVE
jgi:hypothetical protein